MCGSVVKPNDQVCPSCGTNLNSVYLAAGTTLGSYILEDMLGQGGFGITYRARSGHNSVAIKEFFPEGSQRVQGSVLPPVSISGLEFAHLKIKFLEELRLLKKFMGGVNHPNIVDVFETFEANGTVYLVMELLEGETLEARITKLGRLKAKEVRKIASQLCDALETVHLAGLLHRDVKPGNVFLTSDGRAVLIDFGSARGFANGQTMQHTQMVTPGYAPLEQYSSQARVSAATDVYALSATLYHALTGVMPPTAIERMNGAMLNPLNNALSAGLRKAIESGLSLQIADRPADASAFAALVLQSGVQTSLGSQHQTQPVIAIPAPAVPTVADEFIKYNGDVLVFLTIGFLLMGLWLMLAWIPFFRFIEDILIGVFRLGLLMLGAWLFTALLELPMGILRLRRPVGVVRRTLIVLVALFSGVVMLGLSSTWTLTEADLWLWLLSTALFTGLLLLWAYRFPSRGLGIELHHWWDGFWLVVIGGLLQILKIWN
jgi:hypothetical protein